MQSSDIKSQDILSITNDLVCSKSNGLFILSSKSKQIYFSEDRVEEIKWWPIKSQQRHVRFVELNAIDADNVAKVITESAGNKFPGRFFSIWTNDLICTSGCVSVYTIRTHTQANYLLFIAVLASIRCSNLLPLPFLLPRPLLFALIN